MAKELSIDIPLSEEIAKKAVEERSFALDLLSEFKKSNKRMFIIIMVLIGALVSSMVYGQYRVSKTNEYWADVFTSYDFVSYEIKSEDGGNANFIGKDGDITNGIGQSVPED